MMSIMPQPILAAAMVLRQQTLPFLVKQETLLPGKLAYTSNDYQ